MCSSWDSNAEVLGTDEGVNSAAPSRGTHIGFTYRACQNQVAERRGFVRTCWNIDVLSLAILEVKVVMKKMMRLGSISVVGIHLSEEVEFFY